MQFSRPWQVSCDKRLVTTSSSSSSSSKNTRKCEMCKMKRLLSMKNIFLLGSLFIAFNLGRMFSLGTCNELPVNSIPGQDGRSHMAPRMNAPLQETGINGNNIIFSNYNSIKHVNNNEHYNNDKKKNENSNSINKIHTATMKTHIKETGPLKDIPDAREVIKKGSNVSHIMADKPLKTVAKPPTKNAYAQKSGKIVTDYYSTGSRAHYDGLKRMGVSSITKHAFKSPCIIEPHVYSKDTIIKPPGYRKKKIIACFNCPDRFYASHTYNKDFKACPYSECELSQKSGMNNLADMMMFWQDPLVEPPKRPPGQLWTFLGWEAPPNQPYPKPAPKWLDVFNYTISFHNNSDFVFPYDSLVWRDESPLLPNQYYLDAAKRKTKTATWWVSNCKAKSRRLEYVMEMKKYIDIDVFGKCVNATCPSNHDTGCWSELNTTYRFYLSFENSYCQEYVTEKFYKVFRHPYPVIPVVRGGFEYEKHFPPNTFINAAKFASPKELALYLKELSNDPVKLGKMYKEKLKLKDINRKIDWCDFCEQMHTGSFTKKQVIHDIKEYSFRKGCWLPTDIK